MIDWKKYHLVGKSGIVYQNVADPREIPHYHSPALWETPPMKVRVIVAYVEEQPDYLNPNAWWEVDEENKAVVVLIQEKTRRRFIELMDKKQKGNNLSHEEENEVETTNVLLTGLTYNASDMAVRMEKYYDLLKVNEEQLEKEKQKEENNGNEKKKEYRTKSKAGDIAEIPDKMPIITNKDYQNAMTYNKDDKAYLQTLKNADGLNFNRTDGLLYFEGIPASNATIKHLYTKDDDKEYNLEDFNLPLLRVFYAIILNEFNKTIKEDGSISDVITIYYPDLAKKLGKQANISRRDVELTIKNILSFQNIIGITEKGNNILPVLVYLGEDREKNTISFSSPYMIKVIKDIYNVSIRKSKQGIIMTKKNGTPQMLPSYTYLPDLALGKEKNQKAVDIVCIIIATIEQAGPNSVPHISARTIVERSQLLKQSIDKTSNISNKNKFLSRAFSKAWELLKIHGGLTDKYKNIKLPDPKDKDFKYKYIPTMSTLDMVFEFPHEGKIKD